MNNSKLYCNCGVTINPKDIELQRKVNEEGEDYTMIEYECSNCNIMLDYEEWGEIFEEEAIESINDNLKYN